MQNGYIESFNRVYREAISNAYLFNDIRKVRSLTEEQFEEYSESSPYEALQNRTLTEWK
jgi:putative transposase